MRGSGDAIWRLRFREQLCELRHQPEQAPMESGNPFSLTMP
jgi:hypothetical protein